MQIDARTLVRTIAPGALPMYLDAISASAALMGQRGIDRPLRVAHFFAQAMCETGGFTLLRENMNYSAAGLLATFGVNRHSAAITPEEADDLARKPEAIAERVYGLGNPRKAAELGNTQPGDGFRYRGNGVLQMTGRGAHRATGKACGVNFEDNPELATTAEHAMKPAIEEWSRGNLNAAADADDIRKITLTINGGFNGFDMRKSYLLKLKTALIASGDLPLGAEIGSPNDAVKTLQADLNALGASPPLVVDGVEGPTTTAAVRAFQGANRLPVDGVAGPVTLAAMAQALAANR
jgi:putative chitinase